TARGGIATARAQRSQARAGVDKARAQLGVAELTLNRDLAVRKEDLIPQSEVDQARAARDVAEADVRTAEGQVDASEAGLQAAGIKLRTTQTAVESARVKVDAAQSQVSGAQAQVEVAQAAVKRAEANTEQSKLDLSYTTIRSPVDGIILERNVDQGQTIQSSYNTPQLYSIGTNLKHMQLMASLSESDMSRVYRGEKATFTVDAYPDDKFAGTVTQVRNKATTTDNVVTYQVIVAVENPLLKLRPGMTANITLQVREHKQALLVSNSALRWKPQEAPSATPTPTPSAKASPSPSPSPSPRPKVLLGKAALLPDETDHQKVWVLRGKTPVSVDVTTGLSDDSNTEVLDGLNEGQDVITGATYPPKSERKDLF
ncbi:MAG TPA: efflux RND transporter periplasmic adaptor subunit, partial [Candidatus Xenobia bacterium]